MGDAGFWTDTPCCIGIKMGGHPSTDTSTTLSAGLRDQGSPLGGGAMRYSENRVGVSFVVQDGISPV